MLARTLISLTLLSLAACDGAGPAQKRGPTPPKNLTATATSPTEIRLAWQDVSTNEANYVIERSEQADGPFTELATVESNVVTFDDTGLTQSTTYYYRVQGTNAAGASDFTDVASATTQDPGDVTAPSVPASVMAEATATTQVSITWAASTDDVGVTGYRVYLNEVMVTTTVALMHTDTNLAAGTMYCYAVDAIDAKGNASAKSAPSCTTTPTIQPGPNPPYDLVATGISFQQIDLKWGDSASDEQGFRLERSRMAGTGFAQIAQLGPSRDGGMTYSDDAGLVESTVYYYRVRSYNQNGASQYSNEASTATKVPPPAAPTALTATVMTANTIRLAWTDNADNEANFNVEQSVATDGGGFTSVAQPGANAVTFNRTLLSPSTTYRFRVRAQNNGGNSAYSNTTVSTTPGAPTAPTMADAGNILATSIRVSWADQSSDELGFRVERATAAGGPYTEVGNDGGTPAVGPNGETYNVTGLAANTVYFFQVRAVGPNGFSNATRCTAKTP